MTQIQLLEEEVVSLKALQEKINKLNIDLGDISYQKLKYEILYEGLKEELKEVLLEEQELSQKLMNKYGPVSIDLENKVAIKIKT